MTLLDKTTLRILFTTFVACAALAVFWLARKPLLVFLFAMLFAYLLEPLVGGAERGLRLTRRKAVAATYVAILLVLLGLACVVGPRVSGEAQRLSAAAPQLYERVANGSIALQLGQARGWSRETQRGLQWFIVAHRDEVLAAIRAQSSRLTALASNALWLVLIPILAVFFLLDKSRFARNVEGLLANEAHRRLLSRILGDLDDMLAHFVRAQVYVALISGAVYVAGLSLLRVPYSWVLGVIGGLLEFIPLVGPLSAGALILLIAFGVNYGHLLLVLLFLLIWRILQDYVVSPRLLGGRAEIHPLLTIFGILAGGEIAGIIGIYFAVPLMAAVKIFWIRWQDHNEPAPHSIAPHD